jgi:hypothetical protein
MVKILWLTYSITSLFHLSLKIVENKQGTHQLLVGASPSSVRYSDANYSPKGSTVTIATCLRLNYPFGPLKQVLAFEDR